MTRGVPSSYCPHCNHVTYDIFGTCFVCKRDKPPAAIPLSTLAPEPSEDEKRDRGIDLASGAASAVWNANARAALQEVAAEREFLTSDDIWDRLRQNGVGSTERPNAMAGVIRWGWQGDKSTKPLIIAADKPPEMSRGKGRRRGRIMVWRSLVYAA